MATETLARRPRARIDGLTARERDRTTARTAPGKCLRALPAYWPDVSRIIGIKSTGLQTVVDQIRAGLPATTVQLLQKQIGVTSAQFAATVNIPGRTLSRRAREGRLRSDESERVVRLARLFLRAVQVLGDTERARQWLKTPKRAFAGKTPLEYADTEPGAEEVANLLGRLEHGVFA
jgi:putative toxin-antitoxin system antitoxin component (TIGR02293 family)